MNSKKAEQVFEQHNFELLKWNGNFTEALVRSPNGVTRSVRTGGGRAKLVQRIQEISAPPVSLRDDGCL